MLVEQNSVAPRRDALWVVLQGRAKLVRWRKRYGLFLELVKRLVLFYSQMQLLVVLDQLVVKIGGDEVRVLAGHVFFRQTVIQVSCPKDEVVPVEHARLFYVKKRANISLQRIKIHVLQRDIVKLLVPNWELVAVH